jgi:hypothetical protein
MSVRSDILGDIQTVISGIAGIGTVTAGKVEYVDLDNLTFPACFILQGPERKISGSTEHETFAWTVVIEVWCRDIDVEPFHAFVHQAMAVDISRGGFALNCFREGSDPLAVDPGRGIAGFQQEYRIEYRHPFGSP